MEELLKPELKFNITKQIEKELRWFFMSVSPVPLHPREYVIPVLAFELTEAIEKANGEKPIDYFLAATGNKAVSDLLKEIEAMGYSLKGQEFVEVPPIIIPPPPTNYFEKPTVKQFLERLELVANEYCEPGDYLALRDILERVKQTKVGQ